MAYSSISITAPNSAEEGIVVPISTKVTNISAFSLLFRVELLAVKDIYAVPTPEERIGTIEVAINSGQSQVVSGTFTMPAWDTTVLIMVYRFIDRWDFDNYSTKVVSLGVVLAGTIIKWELEYDGKQVPIPAGNISISKRARVHVWGRNDAATKQKLGIRWIVMGPDGLEVEDYSDWELGTTSPGDDHHFYGDWFDLNKLGNYTINAGLIMDQDNPWYVYALDEPLCSVVAIEYKGTIIKKELEYSGSGNGKVPVSNVPIGKSAKLHVWGKNNMDTSQGMGIYWFVADPDGEIAEEYSDWGGVIGAGQDHEFISSGSFDLNKPGKYTTWIELLMGTQDNPVIVAKYVGELCVVMLEEDPAIMSGEIISVAIQVSTGFLGRDIETLTLPASVEVDTPFKIVVVGLNTANESLRLGIRYTITRPDGSTIDGEDMEIWPYTGAGEEHEFIEPTIFSYDVDQQGEWLIKVELLGGSAKQVLNTWEGVMLEAIPKKPGIVDILEMIGPLLILGLMAGLIMPMMKEG